MIKTKHHNGKRFYQLKVKGKMPRYEVASYAVASSTDRAQLICFPVWHESSYLPWFWYMLLLLLLLLSKCCYCCWLCYGCGSICHGCGSILLLFVLCQAFRLLMLPLLLFWPQLLHPMLNLLVVFPLLFPDVLLSSLFSTYLFADKEKKEKRKEPSGIATNQEMHQQR